MWDAAQFHIHSTVYKCQQEKI